MTATPIQLMNNRFLPLLALTPLLVSTPGQGQSNFTRVNDAVPATDFFTATACTFVDYDNDGFEDLFVANWNGSNRLYRNQGDGTFVPASAADDLVSHHDNVFGAAWADFDNDGFVDVLVANGYPQVATTFANSLYHNNGNGSFSKIDAGRLVSAREPHASCAWADYDRDGFVDVFVTGSNSGGTNMLHRNNGDSTFALAASLPNATADAGGAAWSDFNNDGWPDLLVANGTEFDFQPNWFYSNQGNGLFQLLPGARFPSPPYSSQGVAWGDYDNDGFPDAFVSNFGFAPEPNELFHNNGDGSFSRVLLGAIASDRSYSYAVAWGDYDNDGWLDLFVGNRTYPGVSDQKCFLYHNNGDGTFSRVESGPIADYVGTVGGCAWGDYDNDGFLDLFVSSLGPWRGLSSALFRNTGNFNSFNSWLKVRCVGTASNRSAIGAKVWVQARIDGRTVRQRREITSGDGIGSAALIAHFGLGETTTIDSLRVEWPSGTVQELRDVTANQLLTITEPPRLIAVKTNGAPEFTLKGGRGFNYRIDVSSNLTTWSSLGTVTITNRNGTAPVLDPNALGATGRFYRAVLP
jgi:hypothetical protein